MLWYAFYALCFLTAASFSVSLFLLFHLKKTYRYLAEISFLVVENTELLAMVTGAAKISAAINVKPVPKPGGPFAN